MAGLPAWVATIRAARYLRVAPWELEELPAGERWRQRALCLEEAEGIARSD